MIYCPKCEKYRYEQWIIGIGEFIIDGDGNWIPIVVCVECKNKDDRDG